MRCEEFCKRLRNEKSLKRPNCLKMKQIIFAVNLCHFDSLLPCGK
jgi:hypothetical protein